MPHLPSLPATDTIGTEVRRHPAVYRPFLELIEAIMRGPSPLSPGEREMIGAYVAGLNGCGFCYGGHVATAAEFGIDPAPFPAMLADLETAPIAPKMKPLLRYMAKLTLDQRALETADADAVLAAGWSEAQLHDAILVCCHFNFLTRLLDGIGVADDPASYARRAHHHKEIGYKGLFPEIYAEAGR